MGLTLHGVLREHLGQTEQQDLQAELLDQDDQDQDEPDDQDESIEYSH